MTPIRRRATDFHAALILANVLFFTSLYLLPWDGHYGIHTDSAQYLYPMIGFLKQDARLIGNVPCLSLWGYKIPLKTVFYHGPYESWLSLPFLIPWGPSIAAVIIRDMFFGLINVVAAYLVAWALYKDQLTAFLAGLLMASSAELLFAARGAGVRSAISILGMEMLALYYLKRWHETGKTAPLLAAAALLGLGAWTRDWFWGVLLAYGLCGALFFPVLKPRSLELIKTRPRTLAGAAFIFTIMGAPMLLGEAMDRFAGLRSIFQAQVDSMALHAPPYRRILDSAVDMLAGVNGVVNFTYPIPRGGFLFPMLAVCAFSVVAMALARRAVGGGRIPRPLLLAPAFIIFYFPLNFLCPTGFKDDHLYPLLPFVYLLVASAPLFWKAGAARRLAQVFFVPLIFFSACQNAELVNRVGGEVRKTGGLGSNSSSAVNDAAFWLMERGIKRPLVPTCANTAVWDTLSFLGEGRLFPEHFPCPGAIHSQENQWPSARERAAMFSARSPRYLLVPSYPPRSNPYPRLEQVLRSWGRKPRLSRIFPGKDGTPEFAIYRI